MRPTGIGLLLALHAPDGLFSMPVNGVFAVAVLLVTGGAAAALRRRSDPRLVPLMGIMAAFVFAAQMVNFPVASGTTGHLVGGTLAAILLGPWAGLLVMTVVVFFQALLGDGGVTVLGPNIFNMGVVGTCFGYFIYRGAVGRARAQPARVVAAGCFAAWAAVVLASVFASLQLVVSGAVRLDRALPAMVAVHMLIGVGEGLITACVAAFVLRTRPDLVYGHATREARLLGRPAIALGLAAALVIAVFLSLLPTLWDYPDGLESVGVEQGFLREQPAYDEHGGLATLPAYPLGVRLQMVHAKVIAVHRYERRSTGVQKADIIEAIQGVPVHDLTTAAAALQYDASIGGFDVPAGTPLHVVVQRAGRSEELLVRAAATPQAGARPPLMALLPDYTIPGIHGLLSTSLAGALGTLVMFIASLGVGRALLRPGRLARVVQDAEEPAACMKNRSS